MELIETDADDLWGNFKKGSQDAFAKIYQHYFKNLYEYGMRIQPNKELVMDCIQDLFVKLWTNKKQLGEVSNIKSYLLVALRSTIYNKSQKDSRMKPVETTEDYFFEMTFSAEARFIEKEISTERSKKLFDAMNQLNARQKEMLYLKYFEELDYAEIAHIMGITVKGAYKLSARAMDAIKAILDISKSSLLLLMALVRADMFR